MTKITPSTVEQSQKSLKKLNKKLQNEIQSRQKEIKDVQAHYNIRLESKRNLNNEELSEQKEVHANELKKAIDEKNRKLSDIKANLEQNRKILDQEKQTLQTVHRENIDDIKIRQENQLQNTLFKAFDKQRELSDKVTSETEKLNLEADQDIAIHNLKMKDRIDRNEFSQDLKLRKSQQNFEVKTAVQDENFRQLQTQQETTHRNEMNELLKEQQIEQMAREGIYKGQMQRMKKQHSQNMKQTDESYKIALGKLIKNHQSAMDNMKSNFKKHMQQLQNELSTTKEQFVNKAQDQFYQIEKINPSYNRDNEFYYFSLEVPQHEKDLVKIQAQDRKVKISLSRTYENQVQDSVGSQHRAARSEVLSQEFDVKDILDGNQVDRMYKDNLLTFRVKIK